MSDLMKKLEEIEKQLADYDVKIGLRVPDRAENEIGDYLALTRQQLLKTSPIDLAAMIVDVNSYLVFYQKEYNKHKMRFDWCEAEIGRTIAPELKYQSTWSFPEKKLVTVAESEYAQKVDQLRVKSQCATNHLQFIGNRLENFVMALKDLKYTAEKQNKVDNYG